MEMNGRGDSFRSASAMIPFDELMCPSRLLGIKQFGPQPAENESDLHHEPPKDLRSLRCENDNLRPGVHKDFHDVRPNVTWTIVHQSHDCLLCDSSVDSFFVA
jgi:hypothetical protein